MKQWCGISNTRFRALIQSSSSVTVALEASDAEELCHADVGR
jgi:hypothetical protein